MSHKFHINNLLKYNHGGLPKWNTMVKEGSKLHTVLTPTEPSQTDILSNLQKASYIKKKRRKSKTARKSKGKKPHANSIRHKSLKKTKRTSK